MSDLAVSPDLRGPVFVQPNLSGGLGNSITQTIERELPGVFEREKAAGVERQAIAQEQVKTLEQARAKQAATIPPTPPTLAPLPEKQTTSPVEQWGSLAMVLAMFGSAFTRQPLTHALNAAAGVMNAYNASDAKAYKENFERWKVQSDYAIKAYDFQRNYYQDAIDMIGKDQKTALAILEAKSAALNDPVTNAMAKMGNIAGIYNTFQTGGLTVEKLKRENQKLAEQGQDVVEFNEARDELQAAEKAGDPVAAELAKQKVARLTQKAKDRQLVEGKGAGAGVVADRQQMANALFDRYVEEWKNDPKNAGKPFTAEVETTLRAQAQGAVLGRSAGALTGTLTDEAASLLADQFILGDTQAITSLPRSGPSRIKVENLVAEKMKAMPEAARDIAMNRMRMAQARSAATTAGRITMNTELYATEAIMAGKEAILRSQAFPRTELPLVNQAIQAYERNTGDPKLIEFGVALNALRNAYGKMSNPTGTGIHDADKAAFERILNTALTQGQFEAGVNQIIREGQIMSSAAQKAQADVLQHVVPHAPGSANAPAPGAPVGAAPAAGGGAVPPPAVTGAPVGSRDNPVTLKNRDEYLKLPKGTWYLDADGKPYEKRSDAVQ